MMTMIKIVVRRVPSALLDILLATIARNVVVSRLQGILRMERPWHWRRRGWMFCGFRH
jgi:hypothetical protein